MLHIFRRLLISFIFSIVHLVELLTIPPQNSDTRHVDIIGGEELRITKAGWLLVAVVFDKFNEISQLVQYSQWDRLNNGHLGMLIA
jgi:hypothetical protein